MKLAALILSILALLATLGGMFAYGVGAAFICFDVCPPVSSASQQLPILTAATLGPGYLLSLAAWIVGLLYIRGQGRVAWFIVLMVTPLVVVAAIVALLLIVGGSLAPVAVAGPAEVAPTDRQISVDWLTATTYAIIPLIAWPIVSLAAALTRRKAS
jgi:hypothetical protein